MEREVVVRFPGRAQAEPVKDRLVQAGFHAKIHDESQLELLWFRRKRQLGACIEVAADELGGAERFLFGLRPEDLLLRDAIRCPECGSFRIQYPQVARHSLLTNLFLGVGAALGIVDRGYYCEDCHFTWPRHGTKMPRKGPFTAPQYFLDDVEEGKPSPPTNPHGGGHGEDRKAA